MISTITNDNNSQTVRELERDIQRFKTQQNIDKLRDVIIPRELFLREDGSFDMKAHERELRDIMDKGYPYNALLDDSTLVHIYGNLLRDLDVQIQEKRVRAEQRERTLKSEALQRYMHAPKMEDRDHYYVTTAY